MFTKLTDWGFTDHALERILEMKVSAEEIREALLDPETIRIGSHGKEYFQDYARGRIVITVDTANSCVLTVKVRGFYVSRK